MIDFESFSDGDIITSLDLGGVVLTRGSDDVEVRGDNLAGGGNSISGDPFSGDAPFRADFVSLMTSVSVELGDFGPSDDDNLFLEAYDEFGNLLGTDTALLLGSAPDTLLTLSVSFANIAYVLFGSTNDIFQNSVYADNLTFTDAPAIPLPAGGILLATSLAGLWAARRRKQAAS